jgi:hypothetical protein
VSGRPTVSGGPGQFPVPPAAVHKARARVLGRLKQEVGDLVE